MIDLISHPLAMLAYGMACNLLMALQSASKPDKPVHPVEFLRSRPYAIGLGMVASLAAFGGLHATDELGPITALGVGYAGSDILQRFADRAASRLQR